FLHVSIAERRDACALQSHWHKARAIKPHTVAPTPKIRHTDKLFRHGNEITHMRTDGGEMAGEHPAAAFNLAEIILRACDAQFRVHGQRCGGPCFQVWLWIDEGAERGGAMRLWSCA